MHGAGGAVRTGTPTVPLRRLRTSTFIFRWREMKPDFYFVPVKTHTNAIPRDEMLRVLNQRDASYGGLSLADITTILIPCRRVVQADG